MLYINAKIAIIILKQNFDGLLILTGMLSGKYEDDFESTLTAETTTTGETEGHAVTNTSSQAQDDDSNDAARPVSKAGCSEGAQSDYDELSGEGEEEDTLTVSFQDIGTLRRSLEEDEMIRESLASDRSNITTSVSPNYY